MVTVFETRAATQFAFRLSAGAGTSLTANSDGGIDVLDATGVVVAVVAKPWAVDAVGRSLPTYFRVEGQTVVQIVQTHGAAFPVVADPWVQGDCGIISCTVRLDRAATRNARDAGWLIGAAGGPCAVISAGTLAIVCGAAIAPAAVVLAVAAGRDYENGNCLGIRFYVAGGVGWPTEVKRNTYNCR